MILRYIKIHGIRLPQPSKITADLKVYFYYRKKLKFVSSENQPSIGEMWDKSHSGRSSHGYIDIFRDIWKYSGIFRHNGIMRHIQELFKYIFRTLCNLGIFRTLLYLEPRPIQNPGRSRIVTYLDSETYSKP